MGSSNRDPFRRQPNRWAPAYPPQSRGATGQTLTLLATLAKPQKEDKVLDVGCGAGHVAFALAPSVEAVTALEVCEANLRDARRQAAEKQLANVVFDVGETESLPYKDGTFSLVVSRSSAHHFDDVRKSMHEIARVMAKGARALIVDTLVPMDDEVDRFINHLERLRDPTHVRTYNLREWKVLFADAGLKVKQIEEGVVEDPSGENLREWLGRAGMIGQTLRHVTGLMVGASSRIKDKLAVRMERGEVQFKLEKVVILGER